jgi:hypothetical protein
VGCPLEVETHPFLVSITSTFSCFPLLVAFITTPSPFWVQHTLATMPSKGYIHIKLVSPMWDMSCEFMHKKSYFSNRKFVILLTCAAILILPNQDLGIFYLRVQLRSPFPLVSIVMPFPTSSFSH